MEHQHYVKNKKYYEDQLKSMPVNDLRFEKNYQERLKTDVRKALGIEIDDYLEKYKRISRENSLRF